jgi:hypothetical protein
VNDYESSLLPSGRIFRQITKKGLKIITIAEKNWMPINNKVGKKTTEKRLDNMYFCNKFF